MSNLIFPLHIYKHMIDNNQDNPEDLELDDKIIVNVGNTRMEYILYNKHLLSDKVCIFNSTWLSDVSELSYLCYSVQQIVLKEINISASVYNFAYMQFINKRENIENFKHVCKYNVEDILSYLHTIICDINLEVKCRVCPELIISYLDPYLTPQQKLHLTIAKH